MSTIDRRGATVSAADPPIATNPNPDLAWKAPVRVATTGGNITLSGLQTIDGVALAAGDRVLVKDQADATINGIYGAQTGPWTRTIDANNNSQWTTGTQVAVAAGSVNGGASYKLTAAIPIILGTSAMTFALVSITNSQGANPTAKVGLAAVNGSALTFMRSDAAPPIDPAIAPTWIGLHTFTGGLASTPSGLTQGLTVTQAPTGSVGGPTNWNLINISPDTVNAGSNFVSGLSIIHGFGTSACQGGREALTVTLSLNVATSGSNANRFYTAAQITGQAQSSDGGGAGTELGRLYALNPYVKLTSSAQHFVSVIGAEIDTEMQSGSSALDKYALTLVQVATDAVAGSRNDAAMLFANQGGAVGWGTLLQIGDGLNASPLKTTGSILAIKGSPTFANGIDLTGAGSITGSAYKSPGFSVGGASGITAITDTTDATSAAGTNGSLRTLGGLSVAKTIWGSRIAAGTLPGGFTFGAGGADSATVAIIAGATKGIRFGMSSASSTIEGVDSSGIGSFQPLILNGSTLTLQSNGGTEVLAFDTSSPPVVKFSSGATWTANGAGAAVTFGATTPGAIATPGSVAKWFTVKDNGGTLRYIPSWS
jgi:hypothetical protein